MVFVCVVFWFMVVLCVGCELGLVFWCIGVGVLCNFVWDLLYVYVLFMVLVDLDFVYFCVEDFDFGCDVILQCWL